MTTPLWTYQSDVIELFKTQQPIHEVDIKLTEDRENAGDYIVADELKKDPMMINRIIE